MPAFNLQKNTIVFFLFSVDSFAKYVMISLEGNSSNDYENTRHFLVKFVRKILKPRISRHTPLDLGKNIFCIA